MIDALISNSSDTLDESSDSPKNIKTSSIINDLLFNNTNELLCIKIMEIIYKDIKVNKYVERLFYNNSYCSKDEIHDKINKFIINLGLMSHELFDEITAEDRKENFFKS